MATVFWDFEGIVLTDYLQHSRTITGTYCADLIRKCRAALKEKRRGKLRCGVQCHHQATPAHTLYWLTLTSSGRHPNCRFQTASPPIVFGRFGPHWLPFVAKLKNNSWKMEIYWRQWCYLHRKWLAGGPTSRILLQWHTGFGESLDQVHFCRRGLCWKVTKYLAHILLLTISGYELFERPSYIRCLQAQNCIIMLR